MIVVLPECYAVTHGARVVGVTADAVAAPFEHLPFSLPSAERRRRPYLNATSLGAARRRAGEVFPGSLGVAHQLDPAVRPVDHDPDLTALERHQRTERVDAHGAGEDLHHRV